MIFCYTSSFLASTVAEIGGYIQHQYKVSLFKVIKIKFKLGSFCFLLQLMRMYLCHQSKVDSSQQSFLHSLQKLQLFMKISMYILQINCFLWPQKLFPFNLVYLCNKPFSREAKFKICIILLIDSILIHSFIHS